MFWHCDSYLTWKHCARDQSPPGLALVHNLEILSRTAKEIFGTLDKTSLLPLQIYMLEHVEEDLRRFGDIGCLEAFVFEHFTFVVMSNLNTSSSKKGSTHEESVQTMDSAQYLSQWEKEQAFQKQVVGLPRERCWNSLADFQDFFFPMISVFTKHA